MSQRYRSISCTAPPAALLMQPVPESHEGHLVCLPMREGEAQGVVLQTDPSELVEEVEAEHPFDAQDGRAGAGAHGKVRERLTRNAGAGQTIDARGILTQQSDREKVVAHTRADDGLQPAGVEHEPETPRDSSEKGESELDHQPSTWMSYCLNLELTRCGHARPSGAYDMRATLHSS